jgi:hypothetical protein
VAEEREGKSSDDVDDNPLLGGMKYLIRVPGVEERWEDKNSPQPRASYPVKIEITGMQG